MDARSSSSENISDTELDNIEKTISEKQVDREEKAIGVYVEEHAEIGAEKTVQNDGHKKTYECRKCDRKFSRGDNFHTHILNKHSGSAVACNTCGTKFKTSVDLFKKHLVKDYCPLQCSSCGKTFKQKVRLVKHEQVCVDFGFVRKKALAKKNDDDPESDDSSNHKSNGLKCKYCGTNFC